MTDLNTLASLAEILGAVFVVGGLGFGVVQLQHHRQQRRETAAIELLRSFHNPEFSRSPRAVLALLRGVHKSDMKGCSAGEENAIMGSSSGF